jgi:hypothetical protein
MNVHENVKKGEEEMSRPTPVDQHQMEFTCITKIKPKIKFREEIHTNCIFDWELQKVRKVRSNSSKPQG